MNTDTKRDVLKPSEVATLLRVDVRTVKGWLQKGQIEGIRLPGGHWRVTDPALLRQWNSRAEGGDG